MATPTTGRIKDPNNYVGPVTPRQLYLALRDAGFDALTSAAFVAIAGRESGYKTTAESGWRGSTGDYFSTGLFQINLGNSYGPTDQQQGGTADIHGSQLVKAGMTNPYTNLQTLGGSVFGAKLLYAADGLNPWAPQGGTWATNTDLAKAAQASGGEVSVNQLVAISGQNSAGAPAKLTMYVPGTKIHVPFTGPGSKITGSGSILNWPSDILNLFKNFNDFFFKGGWKYLVEILTGLLMIGAGVIIIFGDVFRGSLKRAPEIAAVVGAAAA